MNQHGVVCRGGEEKEVTKRPVLVQLENPKGKVHELDCPWANGDWTPKTPYSTVEESSTWWRSPEGGPITCRTPSIRVDEALV
jgi:hypothetical protein